MELVPRRFRRNIPITSDDGVVETVDTTDILALSKLIYGRMGPPEFEEEFSAGALIVDLVLAYHLQSIADPRGKLKVKKVVVPEVTMFEGIGPVSEMNKKRYESDLQFVKNYLKPHPNLEGAIGDIIVSMFLNHEEASNYVGRPLFMEEKAYVKTQFEAWIHGMKVLEVRPNKFSEYTVGEFPHVDTINLEASNFLSQMERLIINPSGEYDLVVFMGHDSVNRMCFDMEFMKAVAEKAFEEAYGSDLDKDLAFLEENNEKADTKRLTDILGKKLRRIRDSGSLLEECRNYVATHEGENSPDLDFISEVIPLLGMLCRYESISDETRTLYLRRDSLVNRVAANVKPDGVLILGDNLYDNRKPLRGFEESFSYVLNEELPYNERDSIRGFQRTGEEPEEKPVQKPFAPLVGSTTIQVTWE
ncbi:hypothetical protein HOE07_01865 [archaeon]|nr:hypothetical protein [archaeon]